MFNSVWIKENLNTIYTFLMVCKVYQHDNNIWMVKNMRNMIINIYLDNMNKTNLKQLYDLHNNFVMYKSNKEYKYDDFEGKYIKTVNLNFIYVPESRCNGNEKLNMLGMCLEKNDIPGVKHIGYTNFRIKDGLHNIISIQFIIGLYEVWKSTGQLISNDGMDILNGRIIPSLNFPYKISICCTGNVSLDYDIVEILCPQIESSNEVVYKLPCNYNHDCLERSVNLHGKNNNDSYFSIKCDFYAFGYYPFHIVKMIKLTTTSVIKGALIKFGDNKIKIPFKKINDLYWTINLDGICLKNVYYYCRCVIETYGGDDCKIEMYQQGEWIYEISINGHELTRKFSVNN